jgi:hypothetical protein
MMRGCRLLLPLVAAGALCAPLALANKLSGELLNVKAWRSRITVTGNTSGAISGLAGLENYVLHWDVAFDAVLEEQDVLSRFWRDEVKPGSAANRISLGMTSVIPGGCRKTGGIAAVGNPAGDGGPPAATPPVLNLEPNVQHPLYHSSMSITRRHFIESAALAPLAAEAVSAQTDPKTGMPMRTLGKTGVRVSLLAFGAGSRWLMYKTPDKALPALDKALKAGVNYVDSAASYGDGQSETWIGEYLKTHKKDFFLVTKIGGNRTYDDAMRIIERSLKNLGVSQVDLLHIHSLGDEEDMKKIEAPNGQLKAMLKAKDQKMARFLGVTCHTNPKTLADFITRHDFDSTQMALNIAQIGNAAPSDKAGQGLTGASGFEAVAMPVALRKKMGLTAMKVFAQEKLLGKAAPEMLIRYAMTLPVSAAVIGMPQIEHLDFNIQVARSFKPLSKDEMKSLPQNVSARMRASIDRFFADHVDC